MIEPSNLHRDYISQAYLGNWGDEFTQRKSRARIDWLVSEAAGKSVLDIGCSEGILSILLGREGFEVLGIDIHPEAVEYAEKLLRAESAEVSNRIKFRCQDLFDLDPVERPFDTIILGQVLEHFSDPGSVLKRSTQYLKMGGKILVTTPYGSLPHEDHRTIFTIDNFLDLFRRDYQPESLDIVDGNIRFVGVRKKSNQRTWQAFSRGGFSKLIEQNALREQTRLYAEIRRLRDSLDEAQSKYRKLGEDYRRLKNLLEDRSQAMEQLQEQVGTLQSSQDKMREEKVRAEQALAESVEQISDLEQNLSNLRKDVENGARELKTLTISHQNLEVEHRNIVDYYADFQQSTVYRWVIAIRRAIYEPGLRTFLLPFTLIGFAIRKFKRDRERRKFTRESTTSRLKVDPSLQSWKRIDIDLSRWRSEAAKLKIVDRQTLESGFNADSYGYIHLRPGEEVPEFSAGGSYRIILQGEKQEGSNVQLFVVEMMNGKRRFESASINTPLYYRPTKTIVPKLKIRVKGGGRIRLDSILIMTGKPSRPPEISRSIDSLKDVKAACIFDLFSMQCFQPECRLITPTPDNWVDLFEAESPDVLIVESAWEGNGGVWNRRVAQYPNRNAELYAMIRFCNERGIPTVFWNKEDPVHFDAFIGTARWFDYIFTTDSNCIERYKQITDNENVFALPFAAQPEIHNPMEVLEKRSAKIVFAGAYYAVKYSQRKKDLDLLVDVCKNYGLEIYDRNYGKGIDEFEFPDHLKAYVVGGLPVEEVYKAYKGYRFAINVNSVKDSPTMMSRRVFELIASNTPVVSSYSKAIERIFGEFVISSDDPHVIREKLDALYSDDHVYDLFRLVGLRYVLSQHTYEHRLRSILEIVGFDIRESEPGVTVITSVESQQEYRYVKSLYDSFCQKQKALIVLHRGLRIEDRDVTALDLREDDIEKLKDLVAHDWVTVLNPGAYYGAHYLDDLILASKYCSSSVIGKGTYYLECENALRVINDECEYRPVDSMAIGRCIVRAELLGIPDIQTALVNRDYDQDLANINPIERDIFSIDRFNYIENHDAATGERLRKVVDDHLNEKVQWLFGTNALQHSRGALDVGRRNALIPIDTQDRFLAITNIYPSKRDLYRNAFVHRRLIAYRRAGIECDVFVLKPFKKRLGKYVFDGITVFTGDVTAYDHFLAATNYDKFLIHFVDEEMVKRIDQHHPEKPVFVWFHGVEAEAWHRRLFDLRVSNLRTFINRISYSRRQLAFLKCLFKNNEVNRNIQFIFVSNWFKSIVEDDVRSEISNYHIIPNVIDTELFRYVKKTVAQRSRILSIRPYASRKYANDLSVRAVLNLSKKDFFNELEFCFIGKGELFDSTLAPLRDFPNVLIRETFLDQNEIAAEHRKYGVFLCPTRWDSQGVSMGEAMASGLVPVTNEVAGIPEFVDSESGMLVGKNDAIGIANAIETLYHAPEMFLDLSANAAKRIRERCGLEQTIGKEIEIILE